MEGDKIHHVAPSAPDSSLHRQNVLQGHDCKLGPVWLWENAKMEHFLLASIDKFIHVDASSAAASRVAQKGPPSLAAPESRPASQRTGRTQSSLPFRYEKK